MLYHDITETFKPKLMEAFVLWLFPLAVQELLLTVFQFFSNLIGLGQQGETDTCLLLLYFKISAKISVRFILER